MFNACVRNGREISLGGQWFGKELRMRAASSSPHLRVCVDDPELYAREAGVHHPIHGIRASPADAYHLSTVAPEKSLSMAFPGDRSRTQACRLSIECRHAP